MANGDWILLARIWHSLKNMATQNGSSHNVANSLSQAITALNSLRSVLSDAELQVSFCCSYFCSISCYFINTI